MTIFVKDKEGEIKSTVDLLDKGFSDFLRSRGQVIKTGDKKEYTVLPYIFERIDDSDVFIIRELDTEYIKEEYLIELKNSLRK